MIRENRQLVTYEPVEFVKEPVEVQDCRKITDHFRGIYRIYYPNLIKENRRMSTSYRLDLQTLGSQLVIMPTILPNHCFQAQPVGRFGRANPCTLFLVGCLNLASKEPMYGLFHSGPSCTSWFLGFFLFNLKHIPCIPLHDWKFPRVLNFNQLFSTTQQGSYVTVVGPPRSLGLI